MYDVTKFLDEHPGFASSLLLFGGSDASEVFAEVSHSPQAIARMASLEVVSLRLPREGCPMSLRTPNKVQ